MTRRRSQKRTPTGHFTSSWKLPSRVSWSWKEGETSAIVNAIRHFNTTPTPEHEVAAIILQQTDCLQCGMHWKSPNGLANHEKSVHNETRSSRMDTFKPFFEQPRRKCLFLMAYDLVFMKCRPYACKSVNGITAV